MSFLNKIIFLPVILFFISFTACQNASNGSTSETVSVAVFENKLQTITDAQLVDVRTPKEYEEGHLKNAVNMDFNSSDFATMIEKLDKSKPVLIYCLSGGRSGNALKQLVDAGFKSITNLDGGILKWKAADKPLEIGSASATDNGMTLEAYTKLVTNDKYVLVDFNATWCGPCKKLSPILDKIANDNKGKLLLQKIDVDQNQALAQAKSIDAIPYMELYKNGKLVWSGKGFYSETDLLKELKLQ